MAGQYILPVSNSLFADAIPSTFSQDRGDFNEAMLEGKDYLKQKEALLATI